MPRYCGTLSMETLSAYAMAGSQAAIVTHPSFSSSDSGSHSWQCMMLKRQQYFASTFNGRLLRPSLRPAPYAGKWVQGTRVRAIQCSMDAAAAIPGLADLSVAAVDAATSGASSALVSAVTLALASGDVQVDAELLRTGMVVIPLVIWYLTATPGPLMGLVDLIYGPIQISMSRNFNAEDVDVGRQMGEGSFGVVFEGFIGAKKKKKGGSKNKLSEPMRVVLKKVKKRVEAAEEMSTMELAMNHRLKRGASRAIAEFLGTIDVGPEDASGRLTEGLWLVWRYQGDRTLDFYLKQRGFPESVTNIVLGGKAPTIQGSSKSDMLKRDLATITEMMSQIFANLRDIHRTGVVHRDVKPLNLVLALDTGSLKLIDLGACVDLRTGLNYRPDETVMDPTYAAPEEYVMPTNSMRPSIPPVYTLLSPFIWAWNCPDRFDLYSAGLVMMQMCVKQLRLDSGLQAFNAEFKRADYDLDQWRKKSRFSDDDFALLDANDGAGWDLVRSLLQQRTGTVGCARPSAGAALRHRFFQTQQSSASSSSSSVFSKDRAGEEEELAAAGTRGASSEKAGNNKKERNSKRKVGDSKSNEDSGRKSPSEDKGNNKEGSERGGKKEKKRAQQQQQQRETPVLAFIDWGRDLLSSNSSSSGGDNDNDRGREKGPQPETAPVMAEGPSSPWPRMRAAVDAALRSASSSSSSPAAGDVAAVAVAGAASAAAEQGGAGEGGQRWWWGSAPAAAAATDARQQLAGAAVTTTPADSSSRNSSTTTTTFRGLATWLGSRRAGTSDAASSSSSSAAPVRGAGKNKAAAAATAVADSRPGLLPPLAFPWPLGVMVPGAAATMEDTTTSSSATTPHKQQQQQQQQEEEASKDGSSIATTLTLDNLRPVAVLVGASSITFMLIAFVRASAEVSYQVGNTLGTYVLPTTTGAFCLYSGFRIYMARDALAAKTEGAVALLRKIQTQAASAAAAAAAPAASSSSSSSSSSISAPVPVAALPPLVSSGSSSSSIRLQRQQQSLLLLAKAELADRAYEILPAAATQDADEIILNTRRFSRLRDAAAASSSSAPAAVTPGPQVPPPTHAEILLQMHSSIASLEEAIHMGHQFREEQLELLSKMESLLLAEQAHMQVQQQQQQQERQQHSLPTATAPLERPIPVSSKELPDMPSSSSS